jgi:hypothetical protein
VKLNLIVVLVFIGYAGLAAGQTITDPAHIEVYVTPYYNSKGSTIDVGAFSGGLAAKSESDLVATISQMKQSWETLNFAEVYVAAIRLYDLGFRKESIYWFYSAQYRGRLFATLADREKMGSTGDPGIPIVEKVQREGKGVPDLTKIYPRVFACPSSRSRNGTREIRG